MLFRSGIAGAEPRYDVHNDQIYSGAEEFTGVFVGVHKAEKKGEPDIILIGDSSYTIYEDAIYRTRQGGVTDIDYFQKDMPVKFYALDSMLTKLWQADEDNNPGLTAPSNAETNPSGLTDEKDSEEDIRKEGDVWKN